ncbi:MAG TPA: ABC transporter permease subunit [Allosphingosinicella sp.]|jgi:NitT/TauT family transport system permease protein
MKLWRLLLLALIPLFLAAWEAAARSSNFLTLLISSPTRLFAYGRINATTLAYDFAHTLLIAVGGLIMALVVGGAAALAGLRYRPAANFMQGVSTVAQSIPLVVFAPFLILLLGVGTASQIGLASIMAIFPWTISVIGALRIAQYEFDELLLLYDVPFRSRVYEVYVPHALPALASSLRICASLAVLGAVLAEFTGSAVGLGRNIFLGTVRLDPELIMSALLLTSLLGIATHVILAAVERRASWWR